MSQPNFRPQDLPDTIRTFLSTSVQLLEKLNMLEQDDTLLKLIGAVLKGTDMIHNPEQAARRGIGSAVALAFYAGLLKHKVPMYLNDQQERELRAAVKEGIEKAPVELTSLNLNNVFDSVTAKHFIDIHFRYFRRSKVDIGRLENTKYEPRVLHYLRRHLKVFFLRLIDDQSNKYGILRETFERASFQIERKEIEFAAYQLDLADLYNEPTPFSEGAIRLSDLYIEQKCRVLRKICRDYKHTIPSFDSSSFLECGKVGLPNDLHHLTLKWLKGELDHDGLIFIKSNLLLLYGMPGQGKSSYCKRLLNDLLNEEHLSIRSVYFLRLRDPYLDTNRLKVSPLVAIAETISKRYQFETDSDAFENAILILDGMDELAMGQGMSSSEADDLLRILLDTTRRCPNLHVILTSRHGYLQTDRGLENSLVLEIDKLTNQQQHDWLKSYIGLKPNTLLNTDKLAEIQKDHNANLAELLTQPLLLNLVADLEEIPDKNSSKARVYSKLFDHMVGTPWKKKGEKLMRLTPLAKKGMQKMFRDSLREIGFKMFRRSSEYLSQDELVIEGSFTHRFLTRLNIEGIKNGVKTIFISFYFKPAFFNEDSPSTTLAIEFYHKSFQEFMVAEYLYYNTIRFFLKIDSYDEGYELLDPEEALNKWTLLFGQRALSNEIQGYLIDIIKEDKDQKRKDELKERLLHFAPTLFRRGFIDSLKTGGLLENERASALERTLESCYGWFLLTGYLNKESLLANRESRWSVQLQTYLIQLTTFERSWQLVGISLAGINLRGANFSYANLSRAKLNNADLVRSDFVQANLSNSDLSHSDLSDSYLSGANFSNAILVNTNFSGSYLIGTILSHANLSDADLSNADLTGTNLDNTDLSVCSSLYGCKGLPNELELHLKEKHPNLFEEDLGFEMTQPEEE